MRVRAASAVTLAAMRPRLETKVPERLMYTEIYLAHYAIK